MDVHHLRACLIALGLTGLSCDGSQILDPIYAEGSPRLPSGGGAWSAKELLPETYVIDGQSNASIRLNLLSTATLCPHVPMLARTAITPDAGRQVARRGCRVSFGARK